MRVVWLVCLASQLTRDSHISALPKETQAKHLELKSRSSLSSGVTQSFGDVANIARQKIRHKTIALEFAGSTEFPREHVYREHEESDKEVILARALPLRSNRTKSNLDKLVREPKLGDKF